MVAVFTAVAVVAVAINVCGGIGIVDAVAVAVGIYEIIVVNG